MSKNCFCIGCGRFASTCTCEAGEYTPGGYFYSKESAIDVAKELLEFAGQQAAMPELLAVLKEVVDLAEVRDPDNWPPGVLLSMIRQKAKDVISRHGLGEVTE